MNSSRRLVRLVRTVRSRLAFVLDGSLPARLDELQLAESTVGAELAHMREALSDYRKALETLMRRVERTGGLAEWLAEQRATDADELRQLARRVPSAGPLGGEAMGLETFVSASGDRVVGFRGAALGRSDVYLGFEDVFRGPEAEIGERQRPYLALLADHTPVLDVGCGRGELLELLRAEGLSARGVDLDAEMVAHCRRKGLDAAEGDALAAVSDAADDSLGAVVAAQVLEHIPYPDLTAFLRALPRVLRPGGITIFETVNPHNPQALKHFWIDPTHQHPLFPEVVLTLLRLSGFAQGYIWHPLGSNDPDRDRVEQPDYVIVGTTPTAP